MEISKNRQHFMGRIRFFLDSNPERSCNWIRRHWLSMGDDVAINNADALPGKTPLLKETIFEEAQRIVYGDREKVYGDPGKNIRAIAALWNVYLREKYPEDIQVRPLINENDVCAMMRLLKEARLMNTPSHRDSLVDICGYAGVDIRIYEHKKENIKDF